jgi:hypothetical protein
VKAKILVCSLIALVVLAQAADKLSTGKFKDVVTDLTGDVISNATVMVHRDWPSEDTRDLQFATDQTRGFLIELAAGFYDVAVFRPQPFAQRWQSAN